MTEIRQNVRQCMTLSILVEHCLKTGELVPVCRGDWIETYLEEGELKDLNVVNVAS